MHSELQNGPKYVCPQLPRSLLVQAPFKCNPKSGTYRALSTVSIHKVCETNFHLYLPPKISLGRRSALSKRLPALRRKDHQVDCLYSRAAEKTSSRQPVNRGTRGS